MFWIFDRSNQQGDVESVQGGVESDAGDSNLKAQGRKASCLHLPRQAKSTSLLISQTHHGSTPIGARNRVATAVHESPAFALSNPRLSPSKRVALHDSQTSLRLRAHP